MLFRQTRTSNPPDATPTPLAAARQRRRDVPPGGVFPAPALAAAGAPCCRGPARGGSVRRSCQRASPVNSRCEGSSGERSGHRGGPLDSARHCRGTPRDGLRRQGRDQLAGQCRQVRVRPEPPAAEIVGRGPFRLLAVHARPFRSACLVSLFPRPARATVMGAGTPFVSCPVRAAAGLLEEVGGGGVGPGHGGLDTAPRCRLPRAAGHASRQRRAAQPARGELAYNAERVLALEERAHQLYGMWMRGAMRCSTGRSPAQKYGTGPT